MLRLDFGGRSAVTNWAALVSESSIQSVLSPLISIVRSCAWRWKWMAANMLSYESNRTIDELRG